MYDAHIYGHVQERSRERLFMLDRSGPDRPKGSFNLLPTAACRAFTVSQIKDRATVSPCPLDVNLVLGKGRIGLEK
jgi:hypothetical protein